MEIRTKPGRAVETVRGDRVRVRLREVDGEDRVVVDRARRGEVSRMTVQLIDRRARASEVLLDIGAVHCNLDQPFIFTSGWASPVYVDCRRLISTPRERREVIQLAAEEIDRSIGRMGFDLVAGGETAGIPFAAWIADYFFLPMIYVRKKPKEFGRLEQIEGRLDPGQRVVLVEDLTTDAKSKVNFCQALKRAGAVVEHTVVVFYYGIYPEAERNLREAGVRLHALTDWQTTLEVAEARGYFSAEQAKVVREFLRAPEAWSKAHGGV
jgi:orotate phosphoribosyltransferase